ncbi:MAG: hypothetical protein QM477_08805 [Planctomycetota bacterium]
MGRKILAVLLGSGILAQASYWSVMPLWYHVSFLAALLPVCMIGARVITINKPD